MVLGSVLGRDYVKPTGGDVFGPFNGDGVCVDGNRALFCDAALRTDCAARARAHDDSGAPSGAVIGLCQRRSEIALCRFDGRDRVRLPILATSSEGRPDGRRAGLAEGSGRS